MTDPKIVRFANPNHPRVNLDAKTDAGRYLNPGDNYKVAGYNVNGKAIPDEIGLWINGRVEWFDARLFEEVE